MKKGLVFILWYFVSLNVLLGQRANTNSISNSKIKIELLFDSIIKGKELEGVVSFKYRITNNTKSPINFLTLSVSYLVSDSSGNTLQTGFSLDIDDSTPSYLYALEHTHDFTPSNNYCGWSEYNTIPLTKGDTLKHIITITPGESYSSRFSLYGCDIDSQGENEYAPWYTYYTALEDRKKVKIQLLYDNSSLKSNTLYGKKIWKGKLKSESINE